MTILWTRFLAMYEDMVSPSLAKCSLMSWAPYMESPSTNSMISLISSVPLSMSP